MSCLPISCLPNSRLPLFAALLLLPACASGPALYPIDTAAIPASLETDPMTGTGDRADDPAIWVHPEDPALSLILGTNKDEGLHVYDLSGTELQFLDVGQVNNVDLRGNMAAASNDEFNTLNVFQIDPASRNVRHIADIETEKDEPYGICMGQVNGAGVIIPTYKDGSIQVWVWQAAEGGVGSALERTAQIGSQLEGCAVDDATGQIYIGEEEHGIWKLDLTDPNSKPVSVDTIAAMNGLVADVEGLSIWHGTDGTGYLVASAQAANRYVVYDLAPPHAPRGVFSVTASADGSVDAVTHTDGLDISSAALPGFPMGLLVVQDDGNPAPEQDQNFKLVDWSEIATALGLHTD